MGRSLRPMTVQRRFNSGTIISMCGEAYRRLPDEHFVLSISPPSQQPNRLKGFAARASGGSELSPAFAGIE
jgi:hypothetical protein